MMLYGAWIKGDEFEVLKATGSMQDVHRYTVIETEKDPTLKDRWRVGILPQFRVYLRNDKTIIGAFDKEEHAMLFARDYLMDNDASVEVDDVYYKR